MEFVRIKLDKGAFAPNRAHALDAGMDLFSPVDAIIPAGESVCIDTGVHIQLPANTFGKVESKSGLNVKHGVVSCGGVIDSGYTGSIVVKLYNLSNRCYEVFRGDKITQLIIHDCYTPQIVVTDDDFEETDRGDNGFGSTGR